MWRPVKRCALSGAEPLLIDRIDAEYLRYFTPTGRPTGEWAAATTRLARRRRRGGRVRGGGRRGRRRRPLARHADRRASWLAGERAEATKRLGRRPRPRPTQVAALSQQLKQAEVVAAAADATLAASVAALTERRRLQADVTERTAAVAELEKAAAQAHEDELHRSTRCKKPPRPPPTDARRRAAGQSGPRRSRPSRRRAAVRSRRSSTALEPADQDRRGLREFERVERDLASIALTDELMRDIETAAAAVERAAAQAELASAHIEVARGRRHRAAGRRPTRHAGRRRTWSANATTTHRYRGARRADRAGGARCARCRHPSDTRCRTTSVWRHALAAAECDDVAAARVARSSGDASLPVRATRCVATPAALVGDDDVDALRARLSELRDVAAVEHGRIDGPRRLCERPCRTRRRRRPHAQKAIATARRTARSPRRRPSGWARRATRASVAQEKWTACYAELTVGRDRLAQQRATASDDELAGQGRGRYGQGASRHGARRRPRRRARPLPHPTPSPPHSTRRCGRVDALSDRHDEIGRRPARGQRPS